MSVILRLSKVFPKDPVASGSGSFDKLRMTEFLRIKLHAQMFSHRAVTYTTSNLRLDFRHPEPTVTFNCRVFGELILRQAQDDG
jgi:hypothetical protein